MTTTRPEQWTHLDDANSDGQSIPDEFYSDGGQVYWVDNVSTGALMTAPIDDRNVILWDDMTEIDALFAEPAMAAVVAALKALRDATADLRSYF